MMGWIGKRLQTGATLDSHSFTIYCNIFYRLPEIKEGSKDAPNDPELAIRRLFRMSVHNQYFRELSQHPKIVSMISELIGPNVKLLQSMSLLKPPGEHITIILRPMVLIFFVLRFRREEMAPG